MLYSETKIFNKHETRSLHWKYLLKVFNFHNLSVSNTDIKKIQKKKEKFQMASETVRVTLMFINSCIKIYTIVSKYIFSFGWMDIYAIGCPETMIHSLLSCLSL